MPTVQVINAKNFKKYIVIDSEADVSYPEGGNFIRIRSQKEGVFVYPRDEVLRLRIFEGTNGDDD